MASSPVPVKVGSALLVLLVAVTCAVSLAVLTWQRVTLLRSPRHRQRQVGLALWAVVAPPAAAGGGLWDAGRARLAPRADNWQ